MQEYIKALQEEVGLTEEQATKSVQVLLEKIKENIPEPFQAMAANMFLGGDSESGTEEDSLMDKVKQFAQKTKGDQDL